MKIALAGTGAFGIKHLDALRNIDGVTVTAVVSRRKEQVEEVARKYDIGFAGTDLNEVLTRDDVAVLTLRRPKTMNALTRESFKQLDVHLGGQRPLGYVERDVIAGDRTTHR